MMLHSMIYTIKSNMDFLQLICLDFHVNKRIIYELKSILLVDDLVICHFPHFFIEDYQNNIELMNKEMDDITQHMTSYFVCSVVDVLIQNGYRLPLEKKKYNGKQIYCPRFELKTILNSNKNILAGKGDIDVLALNEHKKVIYNLEVKYYQPAISLDEMRSKDAKRILNKKTIEKIMNRHDALDQNKEAVLKLFDIQDNVDEYNIESIIITVRENFFLTFSDFRYYNWNEFNRAIKTKEF